MKQRIVAILAVATLSGAALAQVGDDPRRALAQTEATGKLARERAARLEAAAQSASNEAARAQAASVAIAARIQAIETDIDAAEARSAVIAQLQVVQRQRLAAKQGPTVRLVAALQTMARRPAALTLVQPGSIADVVHTQALFSTILPAIQVRTADLRADVARGRQLRAAAEDAVARRRTAQGQLLAQRQRLAALEARKRAESARLGIGAMAEQDRAIAMGEQARDIGDLVSNLDNAASVSARLEMLPGPTLRPAQPGAARDLPVETVAAESASPAYRLPVIGNVVTGLGEVSATGIKARGLTIATQPGAQVVAPATGRIAFAGAFRAYGQIVVIDHGLGWTTLLTNLSALDVKVGDAVLQGSPIGRTGAESGTVMVELRRRGTPVDIARLAG
ncbi:MAG: peptidoglycan DD-metalloendopeptidase family protein [Sphingomonadales bacterium]